jgi:tryptophanyl-tRNA synthetase
VKKCQNQKAIYIDIFLPEKELKKQINGIVTDSLELEASKNPDTCNAFKIYALLATENEIADMRKNYIAGGWGYGHTKKAILDKILTDFAEQRKTFDHYMANRNELDKVLAEGADKARAVAKKVILRVRHKLGYLWVVSKLMIWGMFQLTFS